MNIAGVQNAMVGFTLFDSWLAGMKKLDAKIRPCGSPLVDAAFKAFDFYLDTQEAQHTALINSTAAQLATYAPNPLGSGIITKSQMAPLLALNLLA